MENTNEIAVPVYKTGNWTDNVNYLVCKTMNIKLPAKVGFDEPEILNIPFEINLN